MESTTPSNPDPLSAVDGQKPHVLFMGPRQPIEDALDRNFEILRYWKEPDGDAFLNDQGSRVDYAVTHTGLREMNKAVLDRLPNLKMIANIGVGYESIDLAECKKRGIAVSNGAGANAVDVAEFAIGLVLDVTRSIAHGDRFVRTGEWKGAKFVMSHRIAGRTMGILGLGQIGSAIASRAEALGMKVIYHSRQRKNDVHYRYCESVQILAEHSDYLVIATPGGDQTRHLVGERALQALGKDGYLINIARGTVIDERALILALRLKWIRGAALDVFENEPTIPSEFFELDNVVLQPHQAGMTSEAVASTADLAIRNILAHVAGRPLLTPVT